MREEGGPAVGEMCVGIGRLWDRRREKRSDPASLVLQLHLLHSHGVGKPLLLSESSRLGSSWQ